jgi:hypothetical protein
MRVPDPQKQPAVRISVAGTWRERDYLRYAPVGAGQGLAPLRDQWAQYILQVDDLPTESLSRLQVRIDLEAGGDLYIDNVQLYDLSFGEQERRQFDKLFALADFQLQQGELGRCWQDLHGYWPQYMLRLVPAPLAVPEIGTAAVPNGIERAPAVEQDQQSAKPGMWERMRGWWR